MNRLTKLMMILSLLVMTGTINAQTVSFYTDRAIQPVSVTSVPQPLQGPIPYAWVRVCNTPLTQTQPCLPLATITDAFGASISNNIGGNFGQFQSDTTGRFTFGCSTGVTYWIQYSGASNTASASYPVGCSGTSTTPSFNTITVTGGGSLSGTFTGNPTFSGNPLFSGSPSFTGSGTYSGNNIHSGSETFTGPKPSISANSENVSTTNTVRWVGPTPLFNTVEAAQTDCLNDATIKGCIIWVVSGFRETFSSTITLGTPTQTVILWLQPDVVLTCNVTGGTDCWDIAQGSGIVGHNVGSLGAPPRTSGAILMTSTTAVIGSMIKPTTCSSAGGSSYVILQNLWIEGQVGATANILLDLCSYNNFPLLENMYIVPLANSVGVKLHASTASGAFTGPNKISNVFVDCSYRTGCRPVQILSDSGTNSVNVIDWEGGYINHPGSGLPNIEINGNANSNKAIKGVRLHVYIENASNGSSIGVKIVDAFNVDLSDTVMQMMDTDTCVDISQSAAGRTGGIHFAPLNCYSPTQAVTVVNNHIDSNYNITTGLPTVPTYNFGGDSSSSVSDYVIGDNYIHGPTYFNGAGASTITSLPTFGTGVGGNGWRICYYQNCRFGIGTASSTLVNTITDTNLVSWFDHVTLPANNSPGGSVPDTNALWSIASNGLTIWKEVAAPGSPGAGFDGCYADSTSHTLKCSYNNSAFSSLVLTPAAGTIRNSLFIADQGTACANGNIALSAGWGTTATVTAVAGQGQTCKWTLTSSGIGQAANPTITWTVPTALPSANVVCSADMTGGTQTFTTINQTTLSATAPVFTFNGTPVAGNTVFALLRCGP